MVQYFLVHPESCMFISTKLSRNLSAPYTQLTRQTFRRQYDGSSFYSFIFLLLETFGQPERQDCLLYSLYILSALKGFPAVRIFSRDSCKCIFLKRVYSAKWMGSLTVLPVHSFKRETLKQALQRNETGGRWDSILKNFLIFAPWVSIILYYI